MTHETKTMETSPGLGFTLPEVDIRTTTRQDPRRACFRARKVLEEIIYDTVALENNPFTFPEVKTLMEGITVGGHKIEDEQQVLNQANSWRKTLDEVETRTFVPFANGLDSALRLHALVAKEEALEWGKFRTSYVGIAGTEHEPPPADTLHAVYHKGAHALRAIDCIHTQAIATYLFAARNQFFWDGNKRTGRLLMNGLLLTNGHDVITVPAKKRQDFNAKMIRFYDSANGAEMVEFLVSCSIDKNLETLWRNARTIPPTEESPPATEITFNEQEDHFDLNWKDPETGEAKKLTSVKDVDAGLSWLADHKLITHEEISERRREVLEDLKRERERKRPR